MKRKRSIIRIRPETLLMIGLICCISFMVHYDRSTGHGVISVDDNGSMVILHDKDQISEYESKGHPIIEYHADNCRMIEMFDVDLNPLFRIVFVDVPINYQPINQYPEAAEAYRNNKNGKLAIELDEGDKADVYYKWITLKSGDDALIVYSCSQKGNDNMRAFNIISYIAITLCCLILSISVYWQCKGVVNRYRRTNLQLHASYLDDI